MSGEADRARARARARARIVTQCVAAVVASWLAAGPAWGHTFPPVRTVVVQVERCELAVLVGYRPGTGEGTQRVLARSAAQPQKTPAEGLRDVLAADALMPLAITVDGKPLVRTSVQAKVGIEPGGMRPMVVVLVTYQLPTLGGSLMVASRDPRATRVSWQDRNSSRVSIPDAPPEDAWSSGVAPFLLTLGVTKGESACATSSPSSARSSSLPHS